MQRKFDEKCVSTFSAMAKGFGVKSAKHERLHLPDVYELLHPAVWLLGRMIFIVVSSVKHMNSPNQRRKNLILETFKTLLIKILVR